MLIRHDLIIDKFETSLVQWADYPKPVFAHNMRVYHSRLETRMAKQILNCSDILSFFEQMSSKTVT